MPLQQLRNVNFGLCGSNLTGALGVGYTILDTGGNVVNPRTTAGVYQLAVGSGIYAAFVTFPDSFHGQILWDTGTILSSTYYAVEQFNVEENDPKVSGSWDILTHVTGSIGYLTATVGSIFTDVEFLKDMEGGRWRLDQTTNQMIFYKADNVTVVATFNLFDINGAPTIDQVTERQRV